LPQANEVPCLGGERLFGVAVFESFGVPDADELVLIAVIAHGLRASVPYGIIRNNIPENRLDKGRLPAARVAADQNVRTLAEFAPRLFVLFIELLYNL
jgi:hypothetical protein